MGTEQMLWKSKVKHNRQENRERRSERENGLRSSEQRFSRNRVSPRRSFSSPSREHVYASMKASSNLRFPAFSLQYFVKCLRRESFLPLISIPHARHTARFPASVM
jgi:hypothetical protein